MKKKTIPVYFRKLVIKRDKWSCQICGKIADIGFKNRGGIYRVFEINPEFINYNRVANMIGDREYISFEIDHIIPESMGGLAVPENLRLLCRGCNRRKGNRL